MRGRLRQRFPKVIDTREIVVVDGMEIPCDAFKRQFAEPSTAAVDAMPPEWRALVHEYGADAHMLFDNAVPQFSNQKAMTVKEARRVLEQLFRT